LPLHIINLQRRKLEQYDYAGDTPNPATIQFHVISQLTASGRLSTQQLTAASSILDTAVHVVQKFVKVRADSADLAGKVGLQRLEGALAATWQQNGYNHQPARHFLGLGRSQQCMGMVCVHSKDARLHTGGGYRPLNPGDPLLQLLRNQVITRAAGASRPSAFQHNCLGTS
jgi:hypothetical protein